PRRADRMGARAHGELQGAAAGGGGRRPSGERERQGAEVRAPGTRLSLGGGGHVNHRPVELGTLLFTLVEPHRGHEVAYNRWYERDHFYAGCMIGPGILAGKRWVSTRPYKDRRYPSESPITGGPPDRGSYLALYWVDKSMQDEWG